MNAIAVLTATPSDDLLEFYSGFVRLGYRVFVVVDDNHFKLDNAEVKAKNTGVSLIQFKDYDCKKAGFFNFTVLFNPIVKKRNWNGLQSGCSAWEKALYYFCCRDLSHDNVWFIEDDCFVPDHEIILNLDRKYENADIISADNVVNKDGVLDNQERWPWWRLVPKTILRPPWAHSLVVTVRLSRKMLADFASLVRSNKNKLRVTNTMITATKVVGLLRPKSLWRKQFFIEFTFHTLALHNQLSVIKARELSGLVFRKEWDVSEMNRGTIYHPLKDRGSHNRYRKMLNQDTMRRRQGGYVV